MGLLWMCLIGLLAGALAKGIMPGPDKGGWFLTMLLGIAGAVVAGFLGRLVGWYQPGEGAGLIASVLGAILVLWIYRQSQAGAHGMWLKRMADGRREMAEWCDRKAPSYPLPTCKHPTSAIGHLPSFSLQR